MGTRYSLICHTRNCWLKAIADRLEEGRRQSSCKEDYDGLFEA